MICVLLIYVVLGSTASLVVKQFKVNETGLKSTNSLWKFVCGLDLNSRGTYSIEGEKIMEDNDKEKQLIIENIKIMKPDEFILLMRDKIKIFWADEDYSWVANNLEEKIYVIGNKEISRDKLISMANRLDKTLYIGMFIFALISIASGIKENKNTNKNLLIILIDLIAVIYLLIEVQPRYSYLAKIFIFILAIEGLNIFDKKINNKKMLKEGISND